MLTSTKTTCGAGYSQHAAAIDNDCLINYCVKANSFGFNQKEIPIQLPPFQNYDDIFAEEALNQFTVVIHKTPTSSTLSIVMGCLLGVVILVNVVFVATKCFHRMKRLRSGAYNEPLIGDPEGYQRV